jgi:very-short-patch-repair endonuclease
MARKPGARTKKKSSAPHHTRYEGGPKGSPQSLSKLEDLVEKQLKEAQFPTWEREYRFHPVRKWRFDFAWPDKLIALEVDGGVFSGGRHVRGEGFVKDCEKQNVAMGLGWRILKAVTKHIKSGHVLTWLYDMFDRHDWEKKNGPTPYEEIKAVSLADD